MDTQFVIRGKQHAVETFQRELEQEKTIWENPGVSIGSIETATGHSALRKPLGLEPVVYFFVVYTAHLAAGLTHDKLRAWLADRASGSNGISVEEGAKTLHDEPPDSKSQNEQ